MILKGYCVLSICLFQIINTTIGTAQTSRVGAVVDNFLIPVPVPSGICSDGKSFWIGNYALAGGSQSIYKFDIWSHNILDTIPAPGAWVAGLAWDGTNVWVEANYPTFSDFSIVKLSSMGQILSHFPTYYSCYWSGIAWNGSDLFYGTNVCSSSPPGQKSMIYKLDPGSGALLDSIPSPSGSINGLVYDHGNIWYCDDAAKYIFEIDSTGKILYEFPSYGGLLTGLTIAKDYLWAVDMAGIGGPRVYEIDIGLTPAIPQRLNIYSGSDIPGKIRLTWLRSSSRNVEWYRIYRDGPLSYGLGDLTAAILIDSVRSDVTTYLDGTVQNGLGYAYWVSAVDSEGVESHVSDGEPAAAWPGLEFNLAQNYPNPFNPTTIIQYEVPYNGDSFNKITTHVMIAIYDVLGRKVATLVDKEESPGEKTVTFNAENLPSGIYFCRMQTGKFSAARKLALIR